MFDNSMNDVISDHYKKIEIRVNEFLMDAEWPDNPNDIEDQCKIKPEDIPILEKFGEDDISVSESNWIRRESPYAPYRKVTIDCSVSYSGKSKWFYVMPSVGKIDGTRPLSGNYSTYFDDDRVVVSVSFNTNQGHNHDYSSHITGIANVVESIRTNLDRLRDDEQIRDFNKNVPSEIQKYVGEKRADWENIDTFKSNLLKELNK